MSVLIAFCGFEQFERTIDRISKLSTETYPPYNIEQFHQLIEIIAVAGFEKGFRN